MEERGGNNLILTNKRLLFVAIYLIAIMTVVVLVSSVPLWITVPIVLVGLFGLTGLLLSVILNIPSDNTAQYIVYALLTGFGFVLLGGVIANFLLPLFGIHHPLAKIPLVVFFDVIILGLSLFIYFFQKNVTLTVKFQVGNMISRIFLAIAFIFPILAWLGAERLNNNGSNTITVVMIAAIAVYVIALAFWNKSLKESVYIVALYTISLSLLLMYSLRSNHILGWDINQEYEVFQTTLQHLMWHASYYAGLDYNACLSITILPTILVQLTHISGEYVFKFLFQIFFALSPVMVYVFAKRYVSTSISAFLSAFLLLSQTWFFEQMPALIRQEYAFPFFLLLLLVLLDKNLKKVTRNILVGISFMGIVLSHYSTAYVAIILLVVASLFSYISKKISLFKDQSSVFKPVFIVLAVTMLFIWQVPITRTIGKVTEFITNKGTVMKPATENAPITESEIVTSSQPSFSSGVSKNGVANIVGPKNTIDTIEEAKQNAIKTYYYQFYPDSLTVSYPSYPVDSAVHAQKMLPEVLSKALAFIANTAKIMAIAVFPLAGLVFLYKGFSKTRSNKEYQLIVLSVSGCALIVLMVAVPYLQQQYNLTRLYLQMFLFLSTVAIVGAINLTKYFKRNELVIACVLSVVFLSTTGLVDYYTGGVIHITLNQPPSTMQGLYIHDSEIAGAHWILNDRNYDDPVEADAQANLRLESFAGMSSENTAVFPETIDPKGYVYISTNNIMTGIASFQYKNDLITFNYPMEFIKNNKNLIYNSGGSQIYH